MPRSPASCCESMAMKRGCISKDTWPACRKLLSMRRDSTHGKEPQKPRSLSQINANEAGSHSKDTCFACLTSFRKSIGIEMQSRLISLVLQHERQHAFTHARRHARTSSGTHAFSPARLHARTPSRTHAFKRARRRERAPSRTHAFTNAFAQARLHEHPPHIH